MVFRLCLHEIASSLGRHVIPTGCISSSGIFLKKIKYDTTYMNTYRARTHTHTYIKKYILYIYI